MSNLMKHELAVMYLPLRKYVKFVSPIDQAKLKMYKLRIFYLGQIFHFQ